MVRISRVAISVVGATALVGSLATNAVASQPQRGKPDAHVLDRKYRLNGSYTITGVLRVNKNNSVYGRLYAHGGFQAWRGILVHSGGINTDALKVTGSSDLASATISNNLQAGSITTTGTITSGGKLTTNGIDAGTGGLTTTGAVATGALTTTGLTTGSLTDTGAFSAASLSTTGTLSAGTATLGATTATTLNAGNSTFTGSVDFTRSTVTGLSLNNLTGTLATLSVGSASSTSAPLTLSANGQSTTLGVSSNGALTVGNLAVSGTLTFSGASGFVTPGLTAPPANGTTSTPGTLTLTGNPINLNGSTNLSGASDLGFSTATGTGSTAGHLLANGDTDLAGALSVNVSGTPGDYSATYTFRKVFNGTPYVVVTPLQDPAPGSNSAPKVWLTTTNSAFTIHVSTGVTGTPYSLPFAYQIVGP